MKNVVVVLESGASPKGDGSSRRSCVPIVALAKLGRAMADTSIRALRAHSPQPARRSHVGRRLGAGLFNPPIMTCLLMTLL